MKYLYNMDIDRQKKFLDHAYDHMDSEFVELVKSDLEFAKTAFVRLHSIDGLNHSRTPITSSFRALRRVVRLCPDTPFHIISHHLMHMLKTRRMSIYDVSMFVAELPAHKREGIIYNITTTLCLGRIDRDVLAKLEPLYVKDHFVDMYEDTGRVVVFGIDDI